jgi:hypothetical protein
MKRTQNAESVKKQNGGISETEPRLNSEGSRKPQLWLADEVLQKNCRWFLQIFETTMEAMKLHQRSHIMYSEGQKGLKLTYKSANQNLLAVKGK